MRTIARYFRRYGLRWAIWGIRVSIISAGIFAMYLVLIINPDGWSMVAVIAMYGIWTFRDALDKRPTPTVVTVINTENLKTGGSANFHVASHALSEAVKRIVDDQVKEAEGRA